MGTEAHENAATDKRFKQFLILTALEAIEKQRNVELDRSKIEFYSDQIYLIQYNNRYAQ